MIRSLPLFHRVAGQPVIVLGEGEAAQARRRLVERAGGMVSDDERVSARLAFVAIDDPAPVVERLRARGILVNVPDQPDLCDFIVPAVLDRAPVLIAIGTGGASSGLAKALRLRLEALMPQSLGMLAIRLFQARPRLRAWLPDSSQRRHALDAALRSGGPLDPFDEASAANVARWLDTGDSPQDTSRVVVIQLRSSDPDDLSLREARLLGQADRIAFEPGVSSAVLDCARADAVREPIESGGIPLQGTGLVLILRAGE